MSVVLAYPTLASPTVSVTLPDVENLPSSRPIRVHQTAYDTDSGVQVVYDWGTQRRAFSLDLWPITPTLGQEVEDFFKLPIGGGGTGVNGVNGRVGQWQLRDSRSREYTVRFAMDVVDIVTRGGPQTVGVVITVRDA